MFMWSPTSNTTGTVQWALNVENLTAPNGSTLVAQAWIVEDSANFKDGTNGLEDYPHVVRGILELGTLELKDRLVAMTGNTSITLPSAYDGSDLSVHLLYQLNYPLDDAPEENQSSTDTEVEEVVPAISLIGSLGILAIAAFTRRLHE